MSDLLKLENIRKRNGDIKAYPITSNIISTETGKNGWGNVQIAVDNATISEMIINGKYTGILYLVSNDEWKKEATP
jgi:hypothetical protein